MRAALTIVSFVLGITYFGDLVFGIRCEEPFMKIAIQNIAMAIMAVVASILIACIVGLGLSGCGLTAQQDITMGLNLLTAADNLLNQLPAGSVGQSNEKAWLDYAATKGAPEIAKVVNDLAQTVADMKSQATTQPVK